jgi:exodeoxyribonuclease V alpha subunit
MEFTLLACGNLTPMLIDLQCQIERITFTSDETGYTVARVKVYGRKDLVTVVGSLMAPTPGEVLKLKGEWKNHPKFGEQFLVAQHKSMVPASVHGITKYLGSGLIKGIGPVMAKRITKKFGEDTLEVIEANIDKLVEIDGIGPKRISMIKKAWAEQKEIREVMVFLQDHGVSSGYATKIFKTYGSNSIRVVQDNPYRLATDIFGIGFITADKIAEKLGFTKDSPLRAQAGILYVLHQLADEGHVYYPYEPLIAKCQEVLEVEPQIIETALSTIATEGHIVIEDLNDGLENGNEGRQAVYLAKYHLSETNVAAHLMNLVSRSKSIREIKAGKAVEWVQDQLDIELAPLQVEAVKAALTDKVLVITGGPGTGKTTIINAVLKIFSKLPIQILLAAPTGRAAKRMNETTGIEAKTIHRLLEFSPKHGGFKKNDEEPLDCDLLIIDEASMIDTILMHHLLKAVPPTATLILVGDVDQLPSVGAGNVLNDVISSGAVPVVKLTQIFRQAQESLIIVNAHKINAGHLPSFKQLRDRLTDFYFIEQPEPEDALKTILELVSARISNRFGHDPVDDIQVLTPMHRGMVGAGNLNKELQKALNPRRDPLVRGGRSFLVGDKVMQIKNNYDKEVFNGDIGRVIRIDHDNQELSLEVDGRKVVYDFSDLDELVLAYAVSVHKSQGSEFPVVVMPILTQHYVLLQRNLLYTGVTRGKKLVIIVGSKKALAIAVRNDKTRRRFTNLSKRLS